MSVDAQYATGEEWRNDSRNNKEMEPKQKQHPVVDGTGDRSKVQCWNLECQAHESRQIGSGQTGDGKSEIYILGINELKWTGMGKLTSDD